MTSSTKEVLDWLDQRIHESVGSLGVIAGTLAAMDPTLVTQLLGPSAAGIALAVASAVQIAQARRAKAQPASIPPPESKP